MAVTGRKLANDLPMKHYVGTKRKLYGGVSSLRISCKSATGALLELPEPGRVPCRRWIPKQE